MTDNAVVKQAYDTAKSMGASDKVMLALFEAGIVESGFENLNHGDRDSVGFLQQRPSQGWPNPMDVPTATRSFVQRAQANEGSSGSAGALAQSVQQSAFPAKYDLVKGQAEALISQAGGMTGGGSGGAIGAVEDVFKMLLNPKFWARVGLFIGGGILILYAIVKTADKNGSVGHAVKGVAKTAAEIAIFK